MTTLLNIQTSPNIHASVSRAVSKKFVDDYLAANPGTTVIDHDLALSPPSHFGPSHLQAFFASPEDHEPESAEALRVSDAFVDELMEADVVVLGTPMHNFGVSSLMKSWIDNVLRAGRTFKYTEEGPVGLLSGKKVVIVVGSGGIYSEGPFTGFEHCGNYLRDILTFLGLTDITILRAEGQALGPEMAEKGLADATAAAAELAGA